MVKPGKNDIVYRKKGYAFSDIIDRILIEDSEKHADFKQLAQTLKGETTEETARNIWGYVRENVRYREDGKREIVKSPNQVLTDGVADCKGMAILSGALLKNLGIPYRYRIAKYDPKTPDQGHIYVRVKDGRDYVILDPVNDRFGVEEKYLEKMDSELLHIRGLNKVGAFTVGVTHTDPAPVSGLNVPDCCTFILAIYLLEKLLTNQKR